MEPYLGEIKMFSGNFAPRGWAFCAGQLLSIAQNQALFSILGTTFGGNGTTNFALPDYRGRVPVGTGQGPGLSNYTIGEQTGSETVTLTQSQMPIHTHVIRAVSGAADQNVPGVTCNLSSMGLTSDGSSVSGYSDAAPDTTLNPNALTPAGGSTPTPILQPLLAITFIIALEGVYPARN
jgi:microcystin-dependent protein